VGLVSHIEALVATFDLEVVQLLRDAIRTTEAAGALEGRTLQPAAVYEPRRHFQPDPVVDPRRHLAAGAVIQRAGVVRAGESVLKTDACEAPPAAPQLAMTPTPSPIQPPWKTVPWEDGPRPAPLKITIVRPDILISKGSVLDLFI
jgi:hypothetical protein